MVPVKWERGFLELVGISESKAAVTRSITLVLQVHTDKLKNHSHPPNVQDGIDNRVIVIWHK